MSLFDLFRDRSDLERELSQHMADSLEHLYDERDVYELEDSALAHIQDQEYSKPDLIKFLNAERKRVRQ